MNVPRWVGVVAVLLAISAATSPALASRRSSLANNLFFEDPKDVFIFPHDVGRYVNYVWFDFATSGTLPFDGDPFLGSGGLLFGDAVDNRFGFGISAHRADIQGALVEAMGFGDGLGLGDWVGLLRNTGLENAQDSVGAPLGLDLFGSIGDFATPTECSIGCSLDALNWIDLLAGVEVTPELNLGTRLSIASNTLTVEDGEADDRVNPSAQATSVDVLLSAGYDVDRLALDVAIELTYASFDAEALDFSENPNGMSLVDEGGTFAVGLGARAFLALAENIDLGGLLFFQSRNRDTTLDDPGDATDSGVRTDIEQSVLELGLGVGPRYRITDEAIVGAYATVVGVTQTTTDPEGINNLVDDVRWILPGLNIAGEFWITHWFAYRSGLISRYVLVDGERQQNDPATEENVGDQLSSREIFFYWSNGVGLTALDGDFAFDAMVNWPVVTAGPALLSNAEQSMFTMVSASYQF